MYVTSVLALTCGRCEFSFPANATTLLLFLLLHRMNDELSPILATFESANNQCGVNEMTEHHQYSSSFFTQVWIHNTTIRPQLTLQVAQLWQRDRASSIDDFRWGSIWGYYILRSYFSHHCDTTQFTFTHHYGKQTISSTRPSCWIQISTPSTVMREQHCGRPSYVYITLTGQLSWQRLRRSAVDLKRKKSLFEPPFRALRGNVHTPSMARWKARGRLYFRRNWTFFAISYGWDVMSGNRSKSAFFEGVGHFERRFEGSPTNHSWYQSSRVIALSCGIKYLQCVI